METLRDNLDFFFEDVSNFQTKVEAELYAVPNSRLEERNKITRFTSRMMTMIQKTEEKLVTENDRLFSKFEENLTKSLEASKQMKNEIGFMQSNTADAIASGARDQLTEQNLTLKYNSLQDRFDSLQTSVVAPVFKQVDEDLEVLKNMDVGFFEKIEYLRGGPVLFSSKLEKDVNPCFPTGFLWINDMIILSDKGNKKLKFFNESGQLLSELVFTDFSPYGVCHIKDNCFAVTLPKAKQIFVVQIECSTASVLRRIMTYSGYSGLCKGLRPESIIATVASNNPGESHVDIIGFQGEVYLTFKNDPQQGIPLFKFPRFVVANQGVLIVSDWRKDSVIFIHETTGSVLKEYKGTRGNPLVNPYDLTLDAVGNVYVLDGKDDTIHVLDLQCNLIDVIKQTPETLSPRLLAYDIPSGRIGVTYGAGDVKSYYHRVAVTQPEHPAAPRSPSFLLPPKPDANFRSPSPAF